MTDRITPPEHIDPDGDRSLSLIAHSNSPFLTVAIHDLPVGRSHPVRLTTAKLLAMIDTEDPDGLRAYLRERSDYLDSPHDIERPLSAPIDTDTAPWPDSPEDVDERRHCDPLPEPARPTPAATERLALLKTVRDLYHPAGTSKTPRALVEWIIDGPQR